MCELTFHQRVVGKYRITLNKNRPRIEAARIDLKKTIAAATDNDKTASLLIKENKANKSNYT